MKPGAPEMAQLKIKLLSNCTAFSALQSADTKLPQAISGRENLLGPPVTFEALLYFSPFNHSDMLLCYVNVWMWSDYDLSLS